MIHHGDCIEIMRGMKAGSGTTGLAARNTGRRAVLIEREAEYVEMIHKRLDGAALPLLDEPARTPAEHQILCHQESL